MAEKFDYLLTLGADADAIVEEVESKIKEAKASVKNQVLTISNVKIDDKGVLNNFIKELQSLAKSNVIKLDIDFSNFTRYQDNIESMQRMIDTLNKSQIKNNITANLDREITVTKKDLASLTDQIDAYWEKIYRKGNTTKEGFGIEFYKGNQLYTKYISNIKEVQNLLSGKKIIDLDEKEIVTVYTYLIEIEKIHARLNASNRTLKDKTKLFDLSAGDFNYKSLITEAEKQMEGFRRKFTTELMTYQKDQASALLNPLVESLKQAQEIAKNINKADSTIELIDKEQVKSSSNEVAKLINKVKELEESKKKLSSKIEGLESKIPLDMSNLTEKDSMRLEEINRLKDEFTDLDRQIFKINSTIEVYKKLNLDGEIGSSILSVKELNENLDEETLSLKDVQKELKKYGNIYKDLSFDEVINKMKEFNTQFDKLKAEGKNKIGNAEFTSLKKEIGSLYKYAIENKYDLSGLGSFNAIAKTFSNGLKIDEEAITKLQNQEKWHQHIIDRIQEEIRLKEKSVNVSQNTIFQEQEQKHEHETVVRESVSDQIILDQSKNVLELIEQAKTLNALLADMKEQLGSLTGEPFEKMQVKIFNVNNELNDTLVKIENLKEKIQKDIEVKFKVDNSSLNNVEKIKQDSLEDKLEKLGLTKENALAMAQDITDKIAIDEKTGIYTETDNLIQTVTEYHDKIKDTNAYIQKGNDLIEERAVLLKRGLQVGEEYIMSDATGKVDIGNGIKKHNADSVLHTHVFSDEVNNLRFSDADIKELVDGTVKKALLLCGNEIATLDMTNVDAGDFESLRNDILGAYTAVFARFGTEIKDGKLVDITSLPSDIQNQATDIVNNLVRNIIQNYGGDLVFDKIVDNDFEPNDDVRLPKIEASEMEIVQKYIDAITSDRPVENIIALQKQFGVLKTSIQDIQKETKEAITSPSLFEDSSGQLSFVEQAGKAIELIEEESGQMAMFENVAEKAIDSAIEGQRTLNDYIDDNIKGQMTLNDLMDDQVVETPSLKDDFINNKEVNAANEVISSISDATNAKLDFSVANELLRESAEQSAEKLKLEAEAMAIIANTAHTTADAKLDFAIANEMLRESIDQSLDKLKQEADMLESIATYASIAADAKKELGEIPTEKKSSNKSKNSDNSDDSKSVDEAAESYKKLTKNLKEYRELKIKSIDKPLKDNEAKRIAELDAEITEATKAILDGSDAQGKYAASTGKALEAQREFSAELEKQKQYFDTTSVKDFNEKVNNLASAKKKTKAYGDVIADIRNKIKALEDITPIDLTNDAERDALRDARVEIQKLISSLSGDVFKDATSEADTWITKMSKFAKQNSAAPKELLSQVDTLRKNLEELRSSAEGINKIQLDAVIKEFKHLEAQIVNTGKTGISFGDKITRKVKDLASYFLTYVSFQDALQAIRKGYEFVKEIDKQMIELEKVSDMSDARLAKSFEKSTEAAKDLGSTIADVISATADWSRLGYNPDEAEKLAEVATIYKNVGDGIDIAAANQSLISTLQGFQMEASEAMNIVDAFNEVANRMPIDSAGIGEALQRSAASFNAANTDLNEAIALITATNAVVQEPTRVGKHIAYYHSNMINKKVTITVKGQRWFRPWKDFINICSTRQLGRTCIFYG